MPALAGALLLVAGCGEQPASDAAASGDAKIACQVAGASAFEPVCSVERMASAEGLVLTIRHPDGAFRRLLVTKDGRGVVAADGAEPAQVSLAGEDGIEVTLAGDRYRLPAKVKPAGAAP